MTQTSTAGYRASIDFAALPVLETATDVIDLLTDYVADMVVLINVDRVGLGMTEQQFQAAFDRTFDAALPEFLRRLDRVQPGLAAKVRRQFVAEQEA